MMSLNDGDLPKGATPAGFLSGGPETTAPSLTQQGIQSILA